RNIEVASRLIVNLHGFLSSDTPILMNRDQPIEAALLLRKGVKGISVLPGELLPWIGVDFDKRLHSHYAANRPQTRVMQRTVALDANPRTGFPIFDSEIVIGRSWTEPLQTAGDAVRFLKCPGIRKPIAGNHRGAGVGRPRRLDLIRDCDRDVAGRKVIE